MANNVTLSYPSAFHHQFLDLNGKPLTGGKLYTYSAGTPTPVPTYKTIGDTSSTNTNTNPIILDNAGMAYIVIETDKAYKFVLFDKNDAKIAEWDNVTGNIGGGGGSSEDIVVVGTPNEIDVSGSVTQGVKRYVISLSNSVKSTILYLVGLYNNVLNSLGNKADKVQGATAGNIAALDASGNLTDSGSKAADFKTKQTPVPDPSASGAGLEFIDSISQNANGEITPHKKSVQDGTTAQKGVVQLQDSIGSTESSTDKAVTPHAVREAINAAVSSAYHAAGTKSVAQLTSSLLVAENEGCVYNVTDSGTTTSDFVDGAGHPINAGDNVGVCDVGGGVYKFDLLSGFVDLGNYLTKTGDASNTTSTFTKASGDSSSMTSGGKLSVLFTAISSFFASVTSALGGKADKANITGATKCKITYNGQGIVTSGADLGASDIPNLPASKITSGTFGTSFIADDAITADKVKDNETLPVNVSGSAGSALTLPRGYASFRPSVTGYKKIAELNPPVRSNDIIAVFEIYETLAFSVGDSFKGRLTVRIRNNSDSYTYVANFTHASTFRFTNLSVRYDPSTHKLLIFAFEPDDGIYCGLYAILAGSGGWHGDNSNGNVTLFADPSTESVSGYPEVAINASRSVTAPSSGAGSTTIPVYVDSNGKAQLCDPSQMSVGNATSATSATTAAGYTNDGAIATALSGKLGTSGDGSNLSVTPDGTSTGYDLGSSTTLKAFAQKFKNLVSALKALAFKDKASYNDLSSGVQSSLDKADSALQSHQSVTDNNPTLSWGTTSKVGTVGSTDLRVTMPANPASYKVPFININSSLASLDLNTLTTQGFYYCGGFQSSSVVLSNVPSELNNYTKSWRLEVINQRSRIEQILVNASDNGEDSTRVMCIWKRHRFSGETSWTPWCMIPLASAGGAGSTTTPVYVDANGQVQPCTQGATLKSNTATLYIAGYTDNNIPYYNVKDIKNGCVNHVDFSGITNSTCNITFEAPTLSTGEEYDYIISLEGYTNNSGYSTGADVENCKQVLHYDSVNNLWIGEPLFLQATDWRQICVVRGNTCEWKRIALS